MSRQLASKRNFASKSMAELTTTDMALLERVAAGSVSLGRVMNTAPGPISRPAPMSTTVSTGAASELRLRLSVGRSRIGSALSIGPIGVPAAGDRHFRA
ncbi:hypothetical protein CN150_33060 [Sinorhizobium meliloti]|uniref:Uncharacterized protein n=1 Tax=Rhizobium meliloti TaxID=382 RepID=I2E1K0_RHIML|nr:short hypothetical protein [Sinorhizobium meliloti]RVH15764.1 hypothetical protein CN215_34215 [Sinorhizobium meliloti]RVK87546.1 hypothetical protein CN150_33060 [Sinorhizobium meliloti]